MKKEDKNRKIILGLVVVAIILLIVILQFSKVSFVKLSNSSKISSNSTSQRVLEKSQKYPEAKELVGIGGYINSEPFNLSDYIGKKVILLDFWTYSCINCQRTLPYIESWYKKYKDKGFLVIGIHTPEFNFEKDYNNVEKATKDFGVKYPVVLDNEYQTWQAYENQYWPREYLIGIDGFIIHDHIGEGGYAETEKAIQDALKERGEVLGMNDSFNSGLTLENSTTDFSKINTEEIYFGYQFSRGQIGNKEGWKPGQEINYSLPSFLVPGKFYLSGTWKNNPDNVELVSARGEVNLGYSSKDVNIVAGADLSTTVSSYVDGNFVKNVSVQSQTLYNVVSGKGYGEHALKLKVKKGFKIYTFTFG